MNYAECVSSADIRSLKVFASSRVAPVKKSLFGHGDDEARYRAEVTKAAGRMTDPKRLVKVLNELALDVSEFVRVLVPIVLAEVLLDKQDFSCEENACAQSAIEYERRIIEAGKRASASPEEKLLCFISEQTIPARGCRSEESEKLIEAIRNHIGISRERFRILEAGRQAFPQPGGAPHTVVQANTVRGKLKSEGFIISIKRKNSVCDVIPTEIADFLRGYYGRPLRRTAYTRIVKELGDRYGNRFLTALLQKSGIPLPPKATRQTLTERVVEYVSPEAAFAAADKRVLAEWCSDVGLLMGGSKSEVVARLTNYYDSRDLPADADRCRRLFDNYEKLFTATAAELYGSNLISSGETPKSAQAEATDYIFEHIFGLEPLRSNAKDERGGKGLSEKQPVFWTVAENGKKCRLADLDETVRALLAEDSGISCDMLVIANEFTQLSVRQAQQESEELGHRIILITPAELAAAAAARLASPDQTGLPQSIKLCELPKKTPRVIRATGDDEDY